MFSLRNKKKLPLSYPQYPLLSGALACLCGSKNVNSADSGQTVKIVDFTVKPQIFVKALFYLEIPVE